MNIADKCLMAAVAAVVGLAGMTLSIHAAAAVTAEPTSLTAVSLPHMPLASQAASATPPPPANSPAPQAIRAAEAIRAFRSRNPAGGAPHAATDAACIIMHRPAGHAFFAGEPATDADRIAYALTDI